MICLLGDVWRCRDSHSTGAGPLGLVGRATLGMVVCPWLGHGHCIVRRSRDGPRGFLGQRHLRVRLQYMGCRARPTGMCVPARLPSHCPALPDALGRYRGVEPYRARRALSAAIHHGPALQRRVRGHQHVVAVHEGDRLDREDRVSGLVRPHGRNRRPAADHGAGEVPLGARRGPPRGLHADGLVVRAEHLPSRGPSGTGPHVGRRRLRAARLVGCRRRPDRPRLPLPAIRAARGGAAPRPSPALPARLLRVGGQSDRGRRCRPAHHHEFGQRRRERAARHRHDRRHRRRSTLGAPSPRRITPAAVARRARRPGRVDHLGGQMPARQARSRARGALVPRGAVIGTPPRLRAADLRVLLHGAVGVAHPARGHARPRPRHARRAT
jgi:hypothetical protein